MAIQAGFGGVAGGGIIGMCFLAGAGANQCPDFKQRLSGGKRKFDGFPKNIFNFFKFLVCEMLRFHIFAVILPCNMADKSIREACWLSPHPLPTDVMVMEETKAALRSNSA